MSCSFEKILSDVKSLTVKLKNSDEMTDKIIKNTSYVHLKLKSMNELQDNLSELARKVNFYESDGALVFEGNMENSNLEKLRLENIELRELLQEYQTALELIMTRYRIDMNELMDSSDPHARDIPQQESECMTRNNLERDLTLKYAELYKVALDCTSKSESNVTHLESSIESLYAENKMMRHILGLGAAHIDSHTHLSSLSSNSSSVHSIDTDEKSVPVFVNRNHIDAANTVSSDDCKLTTDHFLDPSFSDDDRCSVSSDASVKTLV